MTTVDALVCLVALLMLALANEMRRAIRLAEENHWLRADLQASSLTDDEWERLCREASNVVEFPAQWANGNGETA